MSSDSSVRLGMGKGVEREKQSEQSSPSWLSPLRPGPPPLPPPRILSSNWCGWGVGVGIVLNAPQDIHYNKGRPTRGGGFLKNIFLKNILLK